jgi:hypothetical protein
MAGEGLVGFVEPRGSEDPDVLLSIDVLLLLLLLLLLVCRARELNDGGERFVVILFGAVNALRSARIEEAEATTALVASDIAFFSLNPVANDTQAFEFFAAIPFGNDEFEVDVIDDGLL